MSARQSLFVSYAQIAVFQASLPNPFNDWTDAHVNQGFAWRQGSMSFRTKADDGPHEVVIACKLYADAPVEGLRVIEVPFIVAESDPVVIASIGDEFAVDIPEGSYALRFVVAAGDARCIELSFLKTDNPDFKILREDEDLTIDGPLLTHAEPA
jgi:hypothetical protein